MLSIILDIFLVSLVITFVRVRSECKYSVCIVCKFIDPVDVIEPPAFTIISSFSKPRFLYKLELVKFIVWVVASVLVNVILLVFSLYVAL